MNSAFPSSSISVSKGLKKDHRNSNSNLFFTTDLLNNSSNSSSTNSIRSKNCVVAEKSSIRSKTQDNNITQQQSIQTLLSVSKTAEKIKTNLPPISTFIRKRRLKDNAMSSASHLKNASVRLESTELAPHAKQAKKEYVELNNLVREILKEKGAIQNPDGTLNGNGLTVREVGTALWEEYGKATSECGIYKNFRNSEDIVSTCDEVNSKRADRGPEPRRFYMKYIPEQESAPPRPGDLSTKAKRIRHQGVLEALRKGEAITPKTAISTEQIAEIYKSNHKGVAAYNTERALISYLDRLIKKGALYKISPKGSWNHYYYLSEKTKLEMDQHDLSVAYSNEEAIEDDISHFEVPQDFEMSTQVNGEEFDEEEWLRMLSTFGPMEIQEEQNFLSTQQQEAITPSVHVLSTEEFSTQLTIEALDSVESRRVVETKKNPGCKACKTKKERNRQTAALFWILKDTNSENGLTLKVLIDLLKTYGIIYKSTHSFLRYLKIAKLPYRIDYKKRKSDSSKYYYNHYYLVNDEKVIKYKKLLLNCTSYNMNWQEG